MTSFQSFTLRNLIWLVVLTMPLQPLPAACGCGGASGVPLVSGCDCSEVQVEQGTCCCARSRSENSHACCSVSLAETQTDSSCCQPNHRLPAGDSCGAHCHCGDATSSPPFLPITENETVQRLLVGLFAGIADSLVEPVSIPGRFDAARLSSPRVTGACCISLCRLLL